MKFMHRHYSHKMFRRWHSGKMENLPSLLRGGGILIKVENLFTEQLSSLGTDGQKLFQKKIDNFWDILKE